MKIRMKKFLAGALLACAASGAGAQDTNTIGNPQLRDFRLTPNQNSPQPAQPQPSQTVPAPVVVAPPPPVTNQTQPTAQRQPETVATRPAQRQPPPAEAQPQPQAPVAQAAPAPTQAAPPTPVEAAPPIAEPAPAPEPSAPEGAFPWLYAIPAAALALLALAFLFRRRRRSALIAEAVVEVEAPVSAPAPAPAPPAEPEPRPWLELRLKAEKAQATLTETVVQFELEIENSGKNAARNLRIDVKMFNAGQEQDQEIGAFFRTAGRQSTKLNLPGIAPGQVGAIRGEVAMPRDEMRAVVLENKYLFIPMIAVNALYDWGEGETGQTARSYVVGRELEQNEKMGAFRVDLGPRVWRTIGQRQHTLAMRV
jgi:hypothetical protein